MQFQRKTILLLVTLFVLTTSVVVIAVQLTRQPSPTPTPPDSSVEEVLEKDKTAVLSFEDTSIEIDPFADDPNVVFVTVDGQDRHMSGVQIEAVYDPRILSNVSIVPLVPSVLGENEGDTVVFDKSVDTETGKIFFMQGISLQNTTPRTGKGPVAVISFTINPTSSAEKANITILPTSMVTELGTTDSILKTADTLDITIKRE